MLTVSHVAYDTGSQYVGAYSKVMLLHLHGIDPLPMPTKATAAFQGTVCTKRTLILLVQVSPTSG